MVKKTPNENSLEKEIRAFRRGEKAFQAGQSRHFNPYLSRSSKLAYCWQLGWDKGQGEKTNNKYTALEETNAWEPLDKDE